MKILNFILSLVLCFSICGIFVKENVSAAKNEGTTPIVLDKLMFTETGYIAEKGGVSVPIDGISFNESTVTYTLTNINLDVNLTTNFCQVKYLNSFTGTAVVNFVVEGDNVITYNGESKSFMAGLNIYLNHKATFSGNGSLTIDSKLVAASTDSNDFASAGICNQGIIEINEGVTLKTIGGTGNYASYGIYNCGTIINNNGTLIAVSGTSLPNNFDHSKHWGCAGLFNEYCLDLPDLQLLGIYEQNGEKASLTAIGTANAYESYGIYSRAEDGGKATIKVTGGTVNAISEGCQEIASASSVGMHLSYDVIFDIQNCVFNCETKSTLINPLNPEGDYLDPHYVAMEFGVKNQYMHFGDNAYINCKSTEVVRSCIAGFEDPIADLYCLPEGDQLIFGHNCLEGKYPDEVEFEKDFNKMEGNAGDLEEIMANIVFTPLDLTVTFVGKNAYYNACKANAKKHVEEYKDSTIYGSAYQDIVDKYSGNINKEVYDSQKLCSANVAVFDTYKKDFEAEVLPLVSFVDVQIANVDHVNKAINKDAAKEVSLAEEYVGKLNAAPLDVNTYTDSIANLNAIKDEFDAKLADLRKVVPAAPVAEKKGLSAGAIIGIVAGSLVVVYAVGFVLWKKKVVGFLAKPFFNKLFGWLVKAK